MTNHSTKPSGRWPSVQSGSGWRTSSHSGTGNACVEVGRVGGDIGVRDTKADGFGPVLRFAGPVWSEFLARVKRDRVG